MPRIHSYELTAWAPATPTPVNIRHALLGTFFSRAPLPFHVPASAWPPPPEVSRSLLRSVSLTGLLTPRVQGAIDYAHRSDDRTDILTLRFTLSEPVAKSLYSSVLPGLIAAFDPDELICSPFHFAVSEYERAIEGGIDPRNAAHCVHQFWYLSRRRIHQLFRIPQASVLQRLATVGSVHELGGGLLYAGRDTPLTLEEWHVESQAAWQALQTE